MRLKLTNLVKDYMIWQKNKPFPMVQDVIYVVSNKESNWLVKNSIAVEVDIDGNVLADEVPVVPEVQEEVVVEAPKKRKRSKKKEVEPEEVIVELTEDEVLEQMIEEEEE